MKNSLYVKVKTVDIVQKVYFTGNCIFKHKNKFSGAVCGKGTKSSAQTAVGAKRCLHHFVGHWCGADRQLVPSGALRHLQPRGPLLTVSQAELLRYSAPLWLWFERIPVGLRLARASR